MICKRSGKSNSTKKAFKMARNTYRYTTKFNTSGSRRRMKYFRHYRAERKLLTTMENSNYFSFVGHRGGRRILKYLYYFALPHLATALQFGPDRDRLGGVERNLYNAIAYIYCVKPGREPKRLRIWLFEDQTRNLVQK